MNTIDFLSSDIEFPCDSNEPKLSASPCSKLPEPVDWSFHDYYSTVLEKAFAPIQSITDIRHLEPVKETTAPPNYLKDWKTPSVFKVHDKQDDQAVVFVLSNTIQSVPPPQQQQHSPTQQKQNNLRAALRGALDLVENDMQKNMHDALCSPTPSTNHLRRSYGNSSIFNNTDHYLTWKDDILAETLHIGGVDQDLWDDDEDINRGDASPAYIPIDENPIVDSSLPSRISSIMPLSSQQQQQPELPPQQPTIRTPTPLSSYSSAPPLSQSSSPSQSTAKSSKRKSWNMWSKMKQATQPFTKQFKSSASSKNAFKRLFQH